MNEIIPNGTQVLIFYVPKGHLPQNSDEAKFIKGVIVSSHESEDLSYHGSPWYVQIYTIIGDDGEEYRATHNSALIGSYLFRTPDEQITRIKFAIEDNYKRINDINRENNMLKESLNSLIHVELKKETETSTYVPSNDSENIAALLDGFEYDSSKKDEILSRFKDLDKTSGPVKSLKPQK